MTKHTRTEKQSQLSTWILNKLKPEHFKLATDHAGKVRHLCQQRRVVLAELRGYSNPDGTNVKVSIQRIADSLDWTRRTILRRLDDLRKLGLLVDETRGFNEARHRHLDLARAAELLGIPVTVAPRPANLPDSISTELWNQFLPLVDPSEVEFTLDCMNHFFHFGDKSRVDFLLIEFLRHSIRCDWVTEDLRSVEQVPCHVKGCGSYQPETDEEWEEWNKSAAERSRQIYGGSDAPVNQKPM